MSTDLFQQPPTEHPFTPFVRILGKGRTGSRSLSRDEARTAFAMVLRGDAQPLQVGAFLMLLRVKEETGEELAGFVDACREQMSPPPAGLAVDLDWSSYAGKKHQHPWYILAIKLLAQAGYRILIHGCDGHTSGRLYTEQALNALDLPVATGWEVAALQLETQGFSYLPLRAFCPELHQLVQLRPLLGLRSPVNTLTRMLNPLRAPCSIQSIFHPSYAALHQQADMLLGQPRALVFKGDSGEVEIKPSADTRLYYLADAQAFELTLPRRLTERVTAVETPAVEPLRALWQGSRHDAYALEAVLGTTAAALVLLEPTLDLTAAREQAATLWRQRAPTLLGNGAN